MALFKTAPRYLSGVSVFYGDDITKRENQGELVVFAAPATKGPLVPVDIRNIENVVALYGRDNPMSKAVHQFWDGYLDSTRSYPLRPVTMRIGGIKAKVELSFGTILESVDAYTGIENDFVVYINNSATEADQNIKIWTKLTKLLVYDYKNNINTGHWDVTPVFDGTSVFTVNGTTSSTFGYDLESDPREAGLTIATLPNYDIVSKGSLSVTGTVDHAATSVTLTGSTVLVPPTGYAVLTAGSPATSVIRQYTLASDVLTFTAEVGVSMTSPTVKFLGSTVTTSDSQVNMSQRAIYEALHNALLQIETFTPDYIVPGGITFDEVGTYQSAVSYSTILKAAVSQDSTTITVDAAAQWPTSGLVTITKGGFADQLTYTNKVAVGSDYVLTVEHPTYKLKTGLVESVTPITEVTLIPNSGSDLAKLRNSGFITIGSGGTHIDVKYSAVALDDALAPTEAVLTIESTTITSGTENAANTVVTKNLVTAAPTGDALTEPAVSTTFTATLNYETGIGYVKEVYEDGIFKPTWSDTKFVQTGSNPDTYEEYNLAHFGYLLANFCNDAAIGYNTPLTAMNVSLPTNVNSRVAIANWVGTKAPQTVYAADPEKVVSVTGTGTGLLGDAVMVGSGSFNRTGWTTASEGKFADPAFGLLLTDTGYINGGVLYDTYGKIVDLGKFIMVGAGLLTFSNAGTTFAYSDTCGLYALGLLAGTLKNEGISFKRIGATSNVTISTVVNRALYNDLVGAGYVVVTREKRLGWVINNDHSVARKDSAYLLISTTRLVKDVIERKRDIMVNYIGKTANRFIIEAARTKLAEGFAQDVASGFLNGYNFALDPDNTATNIGKLFLKAAINPPLEICQIDIDTVIDRNLNAQ